MPCAWFVEAILSLLLLAPATAPEPSLSPGYEAFYNNDFDGALRYFEEQAKAHPEDPAQHNHVAQAILYRELFRNGSLESQLVSGNNAFLRRSKVEISPQNRQAFFDSTNQALSLCEARLAKNPRDVQALYQTGAAHGLRSTFAFLIEKAWSEGLREAAGSRKAQEKVIEIDPTFVDARLTLGVYQYLVANLPFYLRAAGFLGGFHGDRTGGLEQLESVAREGLSSRNDAKVILAILYRREHMPKKAIPLLEDLAHRFPSNVLFLFEQVQMYSDLGDKIAALKVLDNIEHLRLMKAPGYAALSAEKVAYVAGNLYFWYRDYDSALAKLKLASQHAEELDLNTAVLTWLRIGEIYDLRNDRRNAKEAYQQAIRTAPNSDAASEAKRYMSGRYQRSGQ